MASDIIIFNTELPKDVVKIIRSDLESKHKDKLQTSLLHNNQQKTKVRSSKQMWVEEDNWVNGFIMHYIAISNKSNYMFDLIGLDGGKSQYTVYELGDHYTWHQDTNLEVMQQATVAATSEPSFGYSEEQNIIKNSHVRKLSFSLQLSEETEYEGGALEFRSINDENKIIRAPTKLGTLVCFDSRICHRVAPVTKGKRISLVGWVIGPRWR
jgi:PKHD-type hydroxylase